ncbi:MAG: hypothetical protein KZQ66_11140 [Candidatus Thiodiazotropha sp. (ex Lucinoma aequizonata)]|nr:hypothetical protein [Candidatus Thiodiazotropha sp. (ex Lucinoma aequizonata)]MCU7902479.1 hypothetical protein [Candidatus Thiodiazotropha sp. (ex Lucinoma aequizonata)]
MGFVVFIALQHYTLIRGCWSYALKTNELSNRGRILLFVAALFFDAITVV